ncbi:MAG: TIR domain-containing protein [Burkholderiales bacterium]
MANVFLSYDHDDLALAKAIAVTLEKAGHTVWFDHHIHGGAQYSQKIEQALDAADAVVVLWSERSLNSAWVRDEAAEGRDRGKLVPLTIGGVSPPMGFRQFQTIDLGAWRGRGKVPRADALLKAVASQAELSASPPSDPGQAIAPPPLPVIAGRRLWWPAGAAALALMAAGGAWWWSQESKLPVVEVAAANPSTRSQAAASDLYVKLGSLAQVGQGKWQLIDGSARSSSPDLLFRTADVGSPVAPKANLVLLDKDGSLLWSREFTTPAGGSEADLRQQVAVNAGRVLGCALESKQSGGLDRDFVKLFLTACAALPEASSEEQVGMAGQLRSLVSRNPKFKPAWKQLLTAQMSAVDLANNQGEKGAGIEQLRTDSQTARSFFPDIAQATLADVRMLPHASYAQELALYQKAANQSPDDPQIFAELMSPLMRVGRMYDAVVAARRAVQLDPLSGYAQTQLVLALAYAGQIEAARTELEKAERTWPGSGTVKNAQFAFHLRFGDPRLALADAQEDNIAGRDFLKARIAPTSGNIAKVLSSIGPVKAHPASYEVAGIVQALSQLDQVDAAFAWIVNTPTDELADVSYVLFRPTLANVRKDPRFIAVVERIGLLKFWRESGTWPDFCNDPTLTYDCKVEAAKHAS